MVPAQGCCISLRNHSGAAKLPHAPSPPRACKALHLVSLTGVLVRKVAARAVAGGSTNTMAPLAHSPRACRPEPQKEGEGGMIIWGIFWGAALGSWFGGYGDFGPFVGGILGFFAGLSLRWAIRSAIRTELQAHATKATAQPTRAPQAAVAGDQPVAAAPVAQRPVPHAPLHHPPPATIPGTRTTLFGPANSRPKACRVSLRWPRRRPRWPPARMRLSRPPSPARQQPSPPHPTPSSWPCSQPRTGSWAATPSCVWA